MVGEVEIVRYHWCGVTCWGRLAMPGDETYMAWSVKLTVSRAMVGEAGSAEEAGSAQWNGRRGWQCPV